MDLITRVNTGFATRTYTSRSVLSLYPIYWVVMSQLVSQSDYLWSGNSHNYDNRKKGMFASKQP